MDSSLEIVLAQMSKSTPLTKAFAQNTTRASIAGGMSERYGVTNLAPNNRVMTVALGMLRVMQEGGTLPARKDRHEASNIVIGTALNLQVPDGTNVAASVRPYDPATGIGLPGRNYFISTPVGGF
jgi:hypothetical protein